MKAEDIAKDSENAPIDRKIGTNRARLGITKASEKLLKWSKKIAYRILTEELVESRQRFKAFNMPHGHLDKSCPQKMCKKILKKTVPFPEPDCKTERTNRAGVAT